MSAGALPSLDEIENWSTVHLDEAAEQWPQLGKHSVDVATAHRNNMAVPAGTEWQGQAHEAAFEAADSHATRVTAQASLIDEAGSVAKAGSADVRAMKKLVLDAVTEARQDGFRVNQDLSVTDTKPHPQQTAARQQTGQGHTEFIRWRAGQLVATDDQVNARLQSKAGEIHGSVQGAQVHAVDFRRDTPRDPAGPNPPDPHPDYPRRTVDGKYASGNDGRDGKWEEKIALDKQQAKTGATIARDQVRATVPGATNPDGSLQSRFYDGLQPTGKPNEYIGLEAKGDGVELRGQQKAFDDLVSPKNPATATLNGQEIKIVRTQVVHPELSAADFAPSGGGGGGAFSEPRGGEAAPRSGGEGGFRFGGLGGGLAGLPENPAAPGHGLEIYPVDPTISGGRRIGEADGMPHDP